MSVSQFHQKVSMAAVLTYLITAWFSTGYHSADEHFQIIAFAQWKLGELPVEHLAWEFDTGIRSSLQPWIAVAVFKSASAFSIHDPFTRTFLLRLLTAAFALIAVRGFVRATITSIPESLCKPYILLSYFLWFLPFLHVRFSSEGWSGIFLLLCITAVLRRDELRWWAMRAGAFAGIAILCRPPTGLIVLSVIVWMLIARKDRWREVVGMLVGTGAILILGVLMDSAFYGHFNPSVFKYISMGFSGDTEHRFDELPWYYYAPWVVKYAIPPIGALILLSFAVLCIKQPKHLLVWCVVPFVLAHSIIPHKELRFLYPLADLVPLVVVLALNEMVPWVNRSNWRWLVLPASIVLIGMNAIGLVMVTTMPAGEGRVVLAKEIHRSLKPNERIGYLVPPETAWRIALPDFYRPAGTTEIAFVPDISPVDLGRIDHLIAHPKEAIPYAQSHSLQLTLMTRTEPEWAEHLMGLYTWHEGPAPWALYRVAPRPR